MSFWGWISRLFGNKKVKADGRYEREDRIVQASLEEEKATQEARVAESKLKDVVEQYKNALKTAESSAVQEQLKQKIVRAKEYYESSIQAMKSRGVDVLLAERLRNGTLMAEAAQLTVTDEEIKKNVIDTVTALDKQRETKTLSDGYQQVLDGHMDKSTSDAEAIVASLEIKAPNAEREAGLQKKTPPQVE